MPDSEIKRFPHDLVDAQRFLGYDGVKPVFLGRYLLESEPAPLTDHIGCLDCSVVSDSGGKLCAYRFKGELILRPKGFVWIDGVTRSVKNKLEA